MNIIFGISVFVILMYFIYPLWLMIFPAIDKDKEEGSGEIGQVSLILLTYNGIAYLDEKINFLIKELSVFNQFELVIIDDNSTDGTRELLNNYADRENIRIILKDEHKGIPNTMNLGVKQARYEYIIFCDQRQNLSGNILHRLVEPLKYHNTGAVSACISEFDKGQCCSRMRRYENFIKSKESQGGNLMGVYGPLYAIKKECYTVIPDYIILDDLYLSLKILKSKQIKIIEECKIIDEEIVVLYDYNRAKRYIMGFLQLIKENELISVLNTRQMTMLFWHKYLRLTIPIFLFLSYISLGVLAAIEMQYLFVFSIITILVVLSVIPGRLKILSGFKNLIRINLFYFVAIIDVIVYRSFIRKIALR